MLFRSQFLNRERVHKRLEKFALLRLHNAQEFGMANLLR